MVLHFNQDSQGRVWIPVAALHDFTRWFLGSKYCLFTPSKLMTLYLRLGQPDIEKHGPLLMFTMKVVHATLPPVGKYELLATCFRWCAQPMHHLAHVYPP